MLIRHRGLRWAAFVAVCIVTQVAMVWLLSECS